MMRLTRLHLLLVFVCALWITACSAQDRIIIFVTPTQPPTETPTLLPVTSTFTPSPTSGTPEATALASPSASPTVGTPSFIGPIIGPGYTPPPTETPLPSPTPAEGTPTAALPQPGALPLMPLLDGERLGIQLDINLSDQDWNEAMARIEQLGVRWVKVQLPWRDMQPNGPDERDTEFFRRIEKHLEDASRRGFNVLVSVVKAPAWARSVQAEDGPPDDPNALAAFVSLILNEFNAGLNREMLGEYIDAVEIWNEPNLIREWQGTLPFTGAGYMQLFAPSYQAVRAYSSEIAVVTAGLAPTSTTAGSVDDIEFLRQMYSAGLGSYGDVVVGVHPYGWGNPPDARCCGSRGWDEDPHFYYLETLDAYRTIMNNSGHASTQLWITEFGYASWDGFPLDPPQPWMAFNDRWAQGGYTIRAIQIAQERGDVGVKVLWNLNFAVLSGLITGRDERAAYSMIVPGTGCQIDPNSEAHTERPLYWMLYDALRPDVALTDWCGVPPAGIPGL